MYTTKKFDSTIHFILDSTLNIPGTESFIVSVWENRGGKFHAIHAIYGHKSGCFERKTSWYCSLFNLAKFNPEYANVELPLHVITAKEIENTTKALENGGFTE